MSGNKHDNGVLELGTDEIRVSYQEDTPGQSVEDYIEEKEKAFHEQKNKVKKHFSQVFGNPLKNYPYNEEFKVEGALRSEIQTYNMCLPIEQLKPSCKPLSAVNLNL